MKKSINDYLEGLARTPEDHAQDGIITAIFSGYVHVRLAGSPRKIISNVLIADHIREEILFIGMFVKISNRYERGGSARGRYILTDIPPDQISRSTYRGGLGIDEQDSNVATPLPPSITVGASCTAEEWTVRWSQSPGANRYQLYWALDNLGTGGELIADTLFNEEVIVFDTADPPKIYFAVKALSGTQSSDYSAWVTDLNYLAGSALISFGDEWNHGHVTPASRTRWRVKAGTIEYSDDDGGSWVNVTPPIAVSPPLTCPDGPSDNWEDTPPPNGENIDYIQVIGDDLDIYVLARWQNDLSEWRGWILHTADDGVTWEWSCDNPGGIIYDGSYGYPVSVHVPYYTSGGTANCAPGFRHFVDSANILGESDDVACQIQNGSDNGWVFEEYDLGADYVGATSIGIRIRDSPTYTTLHRIQIEVRSELGSYTAVKDWYAPHGASWVWRDWSFSSLDVRYIRIGGIQGVHVLPPCAREVEVDAIRINGTPVPAGPDEFKPIWMTKDSNYIYVTGWANADLWSSPELILRTFSLPGVDPISPAGTITLGEASLADFESFNLIAYPISDGTDTFVFGRMDSPEGLSGIHHVIKLSGSTFTNIENTWTTDYASSFRNSGTNYYGIKQNRTGPEQWQFDADVESWTKDDGGIGATLSWDNVIEDAAGNVGCLKMLMPAGAGNEPAEVESPVITEISDGGNIVLSYRIYNDDSVEASRTFDVTLIKYDGAVETRVLLDSITVLSETLGDWVQSSIQATGTYDKIGLEVSAQDGAGDYTFYVDEVSINKSEFWQGDGTMALISDIPFRLETPDAFDLSIGAIAAIGSDMPMPVNASATDNNMILASGSYDNWDVTEAADGNVYEERITALHWLAPCTENLGVPTGRIPIQTNTGTTIYIPPGSPGQVMTGGGDGEPPVWTDLSTILSILTDSNGDVVSDSNGDVLFEF